MRGCAAQSHAALPPLTLRTARQHTVAAGVRGKGAAHDADARAAQVAVGALLRRADVGQRAAQLRLGVGGAGVAVLFHAGAHFGGECRCMRRRVRVNVRCTNEVYEAARTSLFACWVSRRCSVRALLRDRAAQTQQRCTAGHAMQLGYAPEAAMHQQRTVVT